MNAFSPVIDQRPSGNWTARVFDPAVSEPACGSVPASEQIFAPDEHHLGYIKVSGFTLEHAANSFPFPQRGALSTTMGHHWLIENNTIQWVNSVGIDIGNQGYPPIRRPDRRFAGAARVKGLLRRFRAIDPGIY